LRSNYIFLAKKLIRLKIGNLGVFNKPHWMIDFLCNENSGRRIYAPLLIQKVIS